MFALQVLCPIVIGWTVRTASFSNAHTQCCDHCARVMVCLEPWRRTCGCSMVACVWMGCMKGHGVVSRRSGSSEHARTTESCTIIL